MEGRVDAYAGPPADVAGGRRHRLRPSVEPVEAPDGALYLVRPGDADLAVRDASPVDRRLVQLLAAGAFTLDQLAARLELAPELVQPRLKSLADAGVLIAAPESSPLDAEDAERFSRQLPYLAELGDEHELQRRLASSRVVVIGCGGLGTWSLAGLAAAGVRRLRLIDDDRVELSNLNRQILYTPADLGARKVDAAAAWLRAFDARVEVEPLAQRVDGPEAARRAVGEADAVVLAADRPPYTLARWVNAACVEHRVPFLSGGQLPPLLRVGPLYLPGRTACFACHERALRAGSTAYDVYVHHLQSAPERGATLGPASAIVGGLLAMELLHLLAGRAPASAGAALLLDLRTGQTQREEVRRDPECAVCQHLR